MLSITPKDGDSFEGKGSVILNGSQLLVFEQDKANHRYWIANATPQQSPVGSCAASSPLCKQTRDLFIDNVWQKPSVSLSPLQPGSWYFDTLRGKVYLPFNPTKRIVELSTTSSAFSGSAVGVNLRNLTVEKYASEGQEGAVGGKRVNTSWTVSHLEIRWNHGAGIELGSHRSSSSIVDHCFVHHNGQLGIAIGGSGGQISNNEVSWNNFAGYAAGWEAGGTKFVNTANLVVQSNYVHDNSGPGLWTDTNNIDTIYDHNIVIHNSNSGIQHEISYHAIIRNNVVKDNGNPQSSWLWDAQIEINNSSDVEIYGNSVEVPPDGGNGITLINQNRGVGSLGAWLAANDYIHHNLIVYLGQGGVSGFDDATHGSTAVNNHFDYNRYIIKDSNERQRKRWGWNRPLSWDEFVSTGQEAHGTCCK